VRQSALPHSKDEADAALEEALEAADKTLFMGLRLSSAHYQLGNWRPRARSPGSPAGRAGSG
jgi:hypothetical protein